jgi:NAD-dependent SIR2 family protein deacetylase
MNDALESAIERAADALRRAEGLLITAGAGMGVDSGLPDFRGTEGFWRAYPVYAKLGYDFSEMANPAWFETDPYFAWGFYGHRLHLYRQTAPHNGFAILRKWAQRMRFGAFVVTSNVDGQFQKAGFPEDSVEEIHGSILHLQCLGACGVGVFEARCEVSVRLETMQADSPLPTCPRCGALARPNILMFGDWGWDSGRSDQQRILRERWLRQVGGALVVVECGAGTAIPTIRRFSESVAGQLIRVNLRESQGRDSQISLSLGAREALWRIDQRLGE